MAYIGHWLHFSSQDMLNMDLSDFVSFINETKEVSSESNEVPQ